MKKGEKRKFKLVIKILILIIVFVLTALLSIFLAYKILLMPVSNNNKIINFEIQKGDTVYGVGNKLKQSNLIKNIYAYKLYVKLHNINDLKYGSFSLNKSMGVKEILKTLSTYGKTKDIVITFHEGKNIKQIAKIVESKTNNSSTDFLNKVSDKEYIKDLMTKYSFLKNVILDKNIYYPLEGYLFPETYNFKDKDVKVEIIIETMLSQTEKVLNKYKKEIDNTKFSIHEILTLASVIELEGVTLEDRKSISSVFINRLNNNMPLGSNVTTYYAAKVDMAQRDLKIYEINMNSPYNTMIQNMSGKLPIGPVDNPSESSIIAALNPNTTDYFYFVSDKKRKVYFAKNYSEHIKLINKLKSENLWYEW